MTVQIEQITDFTAIEDAIESWIATAADFPIPEVDEDANIHWAGYDIDRVRPYILITPISQPSQGQPWSPKELVGQSFQTTYFQPFKWNIQFTAYTDTYDTDGVAIRVTAYRYMQNVINRAYIQSLKNILEAAGINALPQTQNVIPNVLPNIDDDKYIHQATIEYMFSGIVETLESDTDYFTSITAPSEEEGTLILTEI